MKNLNVVYKYSHLYDKTTQQRILLQYGALFALLDFERIYH
jgi:hypothetical protein